VAQKLVGVTIAFAVVAAFVWLIAGYAAWSMISDPRILVVSSGFIVLALVLLVLLGVALTLRLYRLRMRE
jgi:hypothetical protein